MCNSHQEKSSYFFTAFLRFPNVKGQVKLAKVTGQTTLFYISRSLSLVRLDGKKQTPYEGGRFNSRSLPTGDLQMRAAASHNMTEMGGFHACKCYDSPVSNNG